MLNTDDIPHLVIGSCLEVHRELGTTMPDYGYRAALAHELRMREIVFQQDVPVMMEYKGERLPCEASLDFLVENQVVVVVLAKGQTDMDKRRMIGLMRAGGYKQGLMIDFSSSDLRSGIKRISIEMTKS